MGWGGGRWGVTGYVAACRLLCDRNVAAPLGRALRPGPILRLQLRRASWSRHGEAGEDLCGGGAGGAEGADGLGFVAFCEALAGCVEDEGVVVVGGFGEGEEGLEEAVDVGGGEEVVATGDEGDVLEGVVDDHGEVVGGGDVLAGKDDVAEEGGIDWDFAVALIAKGEGAEALAGGGGVESPAVGGVGGEEGLALVGGEGAAGAGVEGAFGAVGGVGDAGRLPGDVAAGAEAGVEDLGGVELCEGGGVGGEAVGLAERSALPREAEPVKVLLDGVVELRADAGVVDVLEAEEEGAVVLVGEAVGDEGGVGVPEVEETGGAWGEAGGHGGRLGKGAGEGDWKIAGGGGRGISMSGISIAEAR